MLFAPRKPKSTVFTMFFASGNKNQIIYSVFWPVPSKNTGIYAVFCMLQEILFPCQRHKNSVNYSVLGLLLGFVEGQRGEGSGSFFGCRMQLPSGHQTWLAGKSTVEKP